MKTSMQELRSDLVTSINTSNKALESIKDLKIREACQKVVKITIDNILNRIDTELLDLEKEQIMDAYWDGEANMHSQIKGGLIKITAEQYYNETFKSE